jgi:hypothetical protein
MRGSGRTKSSRPSARCELPLRETVSGHSPKALTWIAGELPLGRAYFAASLAIAIYKHLPRRRLRLSMAAAHRACEVPKVVVEWRSFGKIAAYATWSLAKPQLPDEARAFDLLPLR